MPKVYLTKRYHFPASHRLHTEVLSEAENLAVYGKCNNPHGHGHNYALEVTLSGRLNQHGMVCDLAALDEFMQAEVVARFDHTHLNSLPDFVDQVPTTENLCREIYRIVSIGFSNAKLERVRLEETGKNSFECGGDLR